MPESVLHAFGADPATYVIPGIVLAGLLAQNRIAAYVGLTP